MKRLKRVLHVPIRILYMLSKFRGIWLWLVIFCLIYCVWKGSSPAWAIFGLVSGIWLTQAFNEKPIFVRHFADTTYMIENNFWLFPLKSYNVKGRIILSFFGYSRDNVVVTYPLAEAFIKPLFNKPLQEIGIADSKIINQEGQNTQYLKFSNSDKLYAFPDSDTYSQFIKLAKAEDIDVPKSTIDEPIIRKYRLGCVLTSVKLWSDPAIL